MKRIIVLCALLALAAVATSAAEEPELDQQAAMEAWMKAAAPGEVHAMLAGRVGNWTMKTRTWMQPGQPPVESEGRTRVEMILGGRYLMEWVEGEAWGMPFEGLSIMGCDNTTGVITNVWYDNLGTMTSVSSAPSSPRRRLKLMPFTSPRPWPSFAGWRVRQASIAALAMTRLSTFVQAGSSRQTSPQTFVMIRRRDSEAATKEILGPEWVWE